MGAGNILLNICSHSHTVTFVSVFVDLLGTSVECLLRVCVPILAASDLLYVDPVFPVPIFTIKQ